MTPRFQQQVRRLHRMGERPVAELLAEIGRAHGIAQDIEARLDRYSRLSDAALDATGAKQFPPLPLREIAA